MENSISAGWVDVLAWLASASDGAHCCSALWLWLVHWLFPSLLVNGCPRRREKKMDEMMEREGKG
jgi:hypothetical protein